MTRSLPILTVLAFVLALAVPGFAQDPGELQTSADRSLDAFTPSSEHVREVARIEASKGDFVSWLVDEANGELVLGIGASFPNKPLVAAEFADSHDPIEAFLAVAELDAPVPDALLAAAPSDAELPATDRQTRLALRQANTVALAKLEDFSGAVQATEATCSQSFRNWVGSVYGSSSCGNPAYNGFAWANSSDTYCTSGCDYSLGSVDKGQCVPSLKSCDIVKGTTYNRRQRLANWNGNPSMSYNGRHAHYGAANCTGNGSIRFFRQRGGTVYDKWVPVNHMYHYYQGVWNLPASASTNVTYGIWKNGLPPSGTYYKTNKTWLTHNSGGNDRAILCGDVKHKYVMSDISSSSCHGPNISLCTGGGDCDSPCFDCVGGTCY